ncbi:peptide methionine sulfoxide reductase [Besnoitia besnoiti]|uniref:peptide-methionine (S)-S-oxide reductase n=1 Tax=Besnoitia besnoiti TaxID=94643 RepID=A0A2A9MHU2_BESBE|nr:peptide methionine sulfoxide reductase [Besnoitia besnoiti]PFH35213.1 peptide methionine sulfoxide reductase [Besnoitia besnoiti]
MNMRFIPRCVVTQLESGSRREGFHGIRPLILLAASAFPLCVSDSFPVRRRGQEVYYPTLRTKHYASEIARCVSMSASRERGEEPDHTPNFLPGVDRTKPFSRLLVGAGCFWGVEKLFRKEFGDKLRATTVGYAGGARENPLYKDVCTGQTGHYEVVEIQFFEDKTSLSDILRFFWRIHDPTTLNRQGNDVGQQYGSAVFVYSPEQRRIAEAVKEEMQSHWSAELTTAIFGGTPSLPCVRFWKAEDYHQLYLERNPRGYCNHRVRF